eukprot:TRINITY_DN9043_c0_g1_i2.p1 TRINITY_DN9043_c0_g1~~TRINITY_DN9043_c0_g1_i2.p1  ORF type:complete len:507 (+),score=101.98 TRINITY_DN9043_c0_g1_i2:75-1595(+)
MAEKGKKGKGKKKQSLGDFLGVAPVGANWADDDGDFLAEENKPDSKSDWRGEQQKTNRPFLKKTLPETGPFMLFAGSLSYNTSEADLASFFGVEESKVRLCLDNVTGQPKGFSYIEFPSKEALGRALELDGTNLGGRNIRLDIAEAKHAGGKGGGRGFGSSGFGGGGGSGGLMGMTGSARDLMGTGQVEERGKGGGGRGGFGGGPPPDRGAFGAERAEGGGKGGGRGGGFGGGGGFAGFNRDTMGTAQPERPERGGGFSRDSMGNSEPREGFSRDSMGRDAPPREAPAFSRDAMGSEAPPTREGMGRDAPREGGSFARDAPRQSAFAREGFSREAMGREAPAFSRAAMGSEAPRDPPPPRGEPRDQPPRESRETAPRPAPAFSRDSMASADQPEWGRSEAPARSGPSAPDRSMFGGPREGPSGPVRRPDGPAEAPKTTNQPKETSGRPPTQEELFEQARRKQEQSKQQQEKAKKTAENQAGSNLFEVVGEKKKKKKKKSGFGECDI